MILQPCKVELTRIHYYDNAKSDGNLSISTISREMCENNFNKNVIIKKNVFGHRWVLRINEGRREVKRRTGVRVVVYFLVFCSIIVAVCFGIFFSLYKNRHIVPDHKTVFKPAANTTDGADVHKVNNKFTFEVTQPSTTIRDDRTTTSVTINTFSTSTSTICGLCSLKKEVCLKIKETDTPKCVKIVDKNDPTGCGGLCPINTHFCQVLDAKGKVFQCSPTKKALVCPSNAFNCGNMCVSREKRCDGLVHCSNGSDEENCDCDLETHFHCGNRTSCLDNRKKCDHRVDCWDKSDEINCTKVLFCAKEEIPCTSGQCVSKDKFCDGKYDCIDRTDEPEGC